MHIAETEEQARADVAFGLQEWVDYFQRVAALPIAPQADDPNRIVDAMNESGLAIIGTPDMAAAQIQRLVDQSGGFGTYLFMGHEWADTQQTKRSYELFMRYVAPRFQGQVEPPTRSRDSAAANREELIGSAVTAVMTQVQKHHEERAAKTTGS
jgi:limonene 1,2-monooxygenase